MKYILIFLVAFPIFDTSKYEKESIHPLIDTSPSTVFNLPLYSNEKHLQKQRKGK
mgnify:CR=1 FL=1